MDGAWLLNVLRDDGGAAVEVRVLSPDRLVLATLPAQVAAAVGIVVEKTGYRADPSVRLLVDGEKAL